MRRARGAYSGCILSWLLRDARGELGVRISNVFSQVTRDRYQLNLRVRSWAHSRAQSVGVYRPSLLASAAAPAKCFTGAQSGANCGISVPAVCARRYPSQTGSRPSPIFSSVSTIRRRLEVVIPSDRHFSLPAAVLSPRSCASLGIAWPFHTGRLATSFPPRPPRRKRPCGDRWLCGRQRSLPCRRAPVRCPAPAHTGRQRRLSPTGSIVNFSQTLQCPS